MRCAKCGVFSLKFICQNCEQILRQISPTKREINGLKIYSFYAYSEIRPLILSKREIWGAFVYKKLAKFSFGAFAKSLKFGEKVAAVAIDVLKDDYSHTAILARAMKTDEISPIFNALRINSPFKYHGRDLNFRLKHGRNFELLRKINMPVILVDDVVTSGATLYQASEICAKFGIDVLFSLTLSDAQS